MKRLFPFSERTHALLEEFKGELPYSLFLNFYGYTVVIYTNSQRMYEHLRSIYVYFVKEACDDEESQNLYIALDEGATDISLYSHRLFPGRRFKGSLLIARELGLIYLISKYSNLAYIVANLMIQSMSLCLSKTFFNVHAASLVKGGTGFLFPGSQHCGKTTLTLGLIKKGYRLLSDDFTIIKRSSLEAMPFPRALNIREHTLPLITDFEDHLISKREFRITDETRWFLDLNEFCGSPYVPNRIVFPRLDPGGETRLEPFQKTMAALELLRNGIAPYLPDLPQPDERSAFETCAQLVANAPTFRLSLGSIDEAIELLLSLEVGK